MAKNATKTKAEISAAQRAGQKSEEMIKLNQVRFPAANTDPAAYEAEREEDEFRGNENNRRVALRRAMQGDIGVAPDGKAAKRLQADPTEQVLADGTNAAVSPNAPATTTENPAGTTADPMGTTAHPANLAGGGWGQAVTLPTVRTSDKPPVAENNGGEGGQS